MNNYTRKTLSRCVSLVLLSLGCTLPLYAAPTKAHKKTTPAPVAAAIRGHALQPVVRHQQARPLKPDERPPLSSSREHFYTDYDRPERNKSPAQRMNMAAAAATCDVNAFATASGSSLVTLVRNASVDGCINTLFSVTGASAGQVFNEGKMVTIANALQSSAASYAGNNSAGTLQLILFLRAGYYVQYGDPTDVGSYGAALKGAIRPALDAFVANAHFRDVNDDHGAVLTEFVTLIDSSGENAHQMNAVKGLLDRYNASYHAYWYMMSAVNNVFTVLFRGHYNADFQALVQSDPSITTSLSGFVARNAAEAGTDNEYLLSNASRELARFLQYAPLQATVKPQVKSILSAYSMTGAGASIWVGTADLADYYDHADCSYFGICGFQTQLAQVVLPITRQCSPDLRLRAQALTPDQVTETCNKVINEEQYFHDRVNDGNTPVANDHNTMLELVIFHSSTDYQTYSGVIFGNDTNNGGMYLEGDPSDPANQPRFVAYEAEWMRPTFEVWNLTHEYVHYLDGRFDMYGDFNAAMSVPSVWWVEGLAEYVSYSYRGIPYPEAIADAGTRQFPLSTIYDNDYNSGEERVYRWGYLGVRYMFEKQPQQVGQILGYFRPGNYTGYASYLQSIHNTHDGDWNTWLTCLNANQGNTATCGGTTTPPPSTPPPTDPPPTDPPPTNLPECPGSSGQLADGCQVSNVQASRAGDSAYFYVYLPAGTSSLQINTSGGDGNADLYVSGRGWPSATDYDQRSIGDGNTESVSITPRATAGYYFVAVVAKAPYSGVAVSASFAGGATPPPAEWPECTGDAAALASGCQHSHVEATRAGDTRYFYMLVSGGSTSLHVETAGGTGDADLYVSHRGWPSATDFDQSSVHVGNSESVDIAQPVANTYYYVAVTAKAPYSDVAVRARSTP